MEKKNVGLPEKIDKDGYPLYPVNEDIYSKSQEEEKVNPEDISKLKEPNENDNTESANEKILPKMNLAMI